MSTPLESLAYQDSAERSYARLRAAASIALLPAALLLLVRGGLLGKLFGLLGAALGVLWLRRAARPPKRPGVTRVDVTERGLLLHGDGSIRELGRDEIESIEAHEETLVVRIALRGGERVELPPGYGNLGVMDLADRLRKALARAPRSHA